MPNDQQLHAAWSKILKNIIEEPNYDWVGLYNAYRNLAKDLKEQGSDVFLLPDSVGNTFLHCFLELMRQHMFIQNQDLCHYDAVLPNGEKVVAYKHGPNYQPSSVVQPKYEDFNFNYQDAYCSDEYALHNFARLLRIFIFQKTEDDVPNINFFIPNNRDRITPYDHLGFIQGYSIDKTTGQDTVRPISDIIKFMLNKKFRNEHTDLSISNGLNAAEIYGANYPICELINHFVKLNLRKIESFCDALEANALDSQCDPYLFFIIPLAYDEPSPEELLLKAGKFEELEAFVLRRYKYALANSTPLTLSPDIEQFVDSNKISEVTKWLVLFNAAYVSKSKQDLVAAHQKLKTFSEHPLYGENLESKALLASLKDLVNINSDKFTVDDMTVEIFDALIDFRNLINHYIYNYERAKQRLICRKFLEVGTADAMLTYCNQIELYAKKDLSDPYVKRYITDDNVQNSLLEVEFLKKSNNNAEKRAALETYIVRREAFYNTNPKYNEDKLNTWIYNTFSARGLEPQISEFVYDTNAAKIKLVLEKFNLTLTHSPQNMNLTQAYAELTTLGNDPLLKIHHRWFGGNFSKGGATTTIIKINALLNVLEPYKNKLNEVALTTAILDALSNLEKLHYMHSTLDFEQYRSQCMSRTRNTYK